MQAPAAKPKYLPRKIPLNPHIFLALISKFSPRLVEKIFLVPMFYFTTGSLFERTIGELIPPKNIFAESVLDLTF
jgi:hypothetical protein